MRLKRASFWSGLCLASLFLVLGGCAEPANQCAGGLLACDGECKNHQTDPSHCGGCGNVCPDTLVCSVGRCSDSCAGNQVACGRSCVDLLSDAQNCGQCGLKCANGASCVDGKCSGGNPPECRDRIPFQTSGSYDVDAKVVQVSGRLTKNGAALPDGSERGYLVFENKNGGSRAMPSFKNTGEATYQGSVFAGNYDVYYQPSSYCATGSVLPCQRVRIREGVALTVSGSLDFEVKTLQVSGKLTKNGAKVPDVGNRGYLVFENKLGGARAMPSFQDRGEATYQGEIFVGEYNIRYQPSGSCSESGALPCQSLILREDVSLSTSGTLDFDVKTVQLSGRLTKNGSSVPNGPNRGYLVFESMQGSPRAMPSFKETGEATFQGEIFIGTYNVVLNKSYYCAPGGVLPCGNVRLRSGLTVTTAGSLDFDVRTVNISGQLSKNGVAVPDGANRGSMTFEQAGGSAINLPNFKETGPATYQGELFVGTYDIVYTPSYYCSSSSPLPCQRLRLRKAEPVTVSGSLDFNVKTVTVSGKLTKNGQRIDDGPNRGYLSFLGKDSGAVTMPAFKDAGEATYQGEVFADVYNVSYQPSYYCGSGTVMPCQTAPLRTDVNLSVSGSLDFDAKTVTLSGKMTQNGQTVADAANRGNLSFVEKSGSARSMASFRDTGEATYQGELFMGAYSIFYNPSYYCSGSSPLPCQKALLVGCPTGN